MKYRYTLTRLLTALQLLAVTQLSAFVVAAPAAVDAQTLVPVAPFRSVELHDGIHAILRHGPSQSVTLLKGSPDHTTFTITDGGRLVIDKCKGRCPRGYAVEIEIVTADIAGIVVSDGGTIESRGSFPRQGEIEVAVQQGGTIDIRSMALDSVTASVEQGGRIFTKPQIAMSASVVNGGEIIYWGDARVESKVRHGGGVIKGTADEADKPLSELDPRQASPPSVPSVPVVRPIQPPRKLL